MSFNLKDKIIWIVLIGILLILPSFIPVFWMKLITRIFIVALLAMSYNIAFGYTGLLSLGHAAFFGIGAYSTAFLINNYTQSILLAALIGVALAAAVSCIIGFLCIKLTGIYFSLLTLAFGMMIYTIFYRWTSVTGGDDGLLIKANPVIFTKAVQTPMEYYYFTLIMVILAIFLMKVIINSPFGLLLQATRDNSTRVESLGVSMVRVKLMSYVISSAFAAFAGVLYIPFKGMAYPGMTDWVASAEPVLMSILGGASTFAGPLAGASIFILLQHFVMKYTDYWLLIFGTILILCVIYLPNGILPNVIKLSKNIYSKITKI